MSCLAPEVWECVARRSTISPPQVGKASALMGRQAPSGRNWRAFDVRTIACVRSATSWQRRQPGSRGRARRARTGLPVHERASGPVSHSHNGARPEGFGLGLLRLAEPTSFGSGDRRRRSDASYPHDPRWIAWNLWRAACSWPKLKADGLSVGRKRIARLMRATGIAGVSRRRSAPITTRQATGHHPSSDLVRRNFMAKRPNELWVADITFLPTLAGFLYLAVVLDAWSRRIVGWAFSADLKTRVVLDALDMAIVARTRAGLCGLPGGGRSRVKPRLRRPNSLLTGKIQGIFLENARRGKEWSRFLGVKSMACR